MRFVLASLIVLCSVEALHSAEPRWTLSFTLDNQRIEGTPLDWTEQHAYLLSRDGRLYDFPTSAAKDARKSSPNFRGYSAAEMRDRLSRELGKAFEVTHTGHYLVAHPRGQKKDWAPRFEEMYQQFVHYFTIRGLAPKEPEFPLVAIVFPTQQDFQRYAAAEGSPMGTGYLGYYSGRSNRVALFDQQGSGGSSSANADTVIHEVTHQTAYNTGVHRRFTATPRWLAEGLGTMFEARGVWNSRSYPKQTDRINQGRLRDFKAGLSRRPKGLIAELVSSDRYFEADAASAYCEAWALSFYLAEKMPRKYCDYLSLTSRKATFAEYTGAERLKDFTAIFGADLKLLEAQFLKFMSEL